MSTNKYQATRQFNPTEFIAKKLKKWLNKNGTDTLHIDAAT